MIIISPVPAILSSFLLAGLTPALPAAPATPDEQVIVDHCLAEGASESECACGLEAAREILTPAEMGIVAELAPALSNETSVDAALMRAPALMQERGMDFEDFMLVLDKVVQHSEIVETRCADPAPAE